MIQRLSKFILHTLWGWKIVNSFPKDLKKYVVISAPHTSWLDFLLGVLTKYSLNIPANYIGKASLFRPPFGFIFKWFGGTPVNRSESSNLVDEIVTIFNSREQFILALSPEGTRQKVDKWKTGFYYIAKGAQVPIVMFTMDFEHKQLKISEPYYTTDDMKADFKHFHDFYEGVVGKHPGLS